jgi:hypothetical protein
MAQARFDRLARVLGRVTTRRAGLGALVGAALGRMTAVVGARPLGKQPEVEGPCGNGSRKANRCTKDSQCCTGLCNTKTGKKNKDGKGRCRCVNKGKACKADRNCCGGRACVTGVCSGGGSKCIALGGACT